jgi:hypothetical protein
MFPFFFCLMRYVKTCAHTQSNLQTIHMFRFTSAALAKFHVPVDGRLSLHKTLRTLSATKASPFVNACAFHNKVFARLSRSTRARLNADAANIKGAERKELRRVLRK